MMGCLMKFVNIFVLFLIGISFSQEIGTTSELGSDSNIGKQLESVQTEFETSEPNKMTETEILEELSKPGNEELLEKLKRDGSTFDNMEDINANKIENKKKSEELDNDLENGDKEDDEKELNKVKSDQLFFDIQTYYESIKDYFGYNIFLNIDTESMFGAAYSTKAYTLSYGDELVLTLWGDVKMRERLIISDDGNVYIPDLDIIYLYGYTIDQARELLKNKLSQYFVTLNPLDNKPTSFMDLSIWKKQNIQVFCNGELVRPGSYSLGPNATMFTAIMRAKGITAKGTLREVKLIRNGNVVVTLDLYDYLSTGNNVSDVPLMNGDNIFVGQRKNSIRLKGEVLNPLIYELKENENLSHLIKYSGGILPTASVDKIKIERLEPVNIRTQAVVYTSVIDTSYTKVIGNNLEIEPIKLCDHDIVTIMAVPRILSNYVVIDGAVYRKGKFNFANGMSVRDLISKSGGILADAFTKKAELHRMNLDQSKTYISLNLEHERDSDLKLNNMDSIKIYSKWEIKSRNIAIITGNIRKPGFVYFPDSTRVSDLIFSRGGLEDEWRRNRTYMMRATLTRYNDDGITTMIKDIDLNKVLDRDNEEDILVKDGDYIRIYNINVIKNEETVNITGYVKKEGEYNLSSNMKVEDLILQAYGFKEGANEYKAIVFRMINDEYNSDSLSQVFEIEIKRDFFVKEGTPKSNFVLKANDHVVIRKNVNYQELRKITISGEVRNPGLYSLVRKDETFGELIHRAGGLSSESFIHGTILQRDSLRIIADFKKALEDNLSSHIIMKDGDDIHIPKKPGVVTVEGFVYTPGTIAYRDGWDIADYINAAGGTKKDIEYLPTAPVIYYPGGTAEVDDGWYFTPKVLNGSRIVVSSVKRQPETQWANEIRTWLGVLTSTLTIVVLVAALQD